MATIDKDLLLDKIDRLLKLHNYAREDWFANAIHNTVWDAPEIETDGDTIYRADAIKAVKDAYVMDAIYEVISEDIINALSALPSAEPTAEEVWSVAQKVFRSTLTYREAVDYVKEVEKQHERFNQQSRSD